MSNPIDTQHAGVDADATHTFFDPNDHLKVPLESGEEITLTSGSDFPMNAHPDTEVIFDATQIAHDECRVLTGTSWKSAKGMIEKIDRSSSDELLRLLMSATRCVNATSFDEAQKDPQRFDDFNADLQIMLLVMRKALNRPLLIFLPTDTFKKVSSASEFQQGALVL